MTDGGSGPWVTGSVVCVQLEDSTVDATVLCTLRIDNRVESIRPQSSPPQYLGGPAAPCPHPLLDTPTHLLSHPPNSLLHSFFF